MLSIYTIQGEQSECPPRDETNRSRRRRHRFAWESQLNRPPVSLSFTSQNGCTRQERLTNHFVNMQRNDLNSSIIMSCFGEKIHIHIHIYRYTHRYPTAYTIRLACSYSKDEKRTNASEWVWVSSYSPFWFFTSNSALCCVVMEPVCRQRTVYGLGAQKLDAQMYTR